MKISQDNNYGNNFPLLWATMMTLQEIYQPDEAEEAHKEMEQEILQEKVINK